MVSTPLLVLWDIDHTLIETGGVGSEIYAAAFEKVTGKPLAELASVAGRTEPVIFRDTLALNDVDDRDGMYAWFADEQAAGYRQRTADLRQRGRALPGAADALSALSGRQGVLQSIVTGNTRPASEAKLAAFGLDTWLDFDAAAYGTDSDVRADLVEIARQRAASRGWEFTPATTVIIGDTPADVAAARDGGARIVAVATGSYPQHDLAGSGADTVLPDLGDTAAFLAALDASQPPQ
jgi:phosphoglycolate phosphatase-like HAD superfamily hydrolase